MKFRIEEVSGRPWARFDSEEPPRSWLLSFFLEETRNNEALYLSEIEKAENGQVIEDLYGDHVSTLLYPDKVIIETLWPTGGSEADPETTQITLQEAKNLVLDWQAVLEQWRAKRA